MEKIKLKNIIKYYGDKKILDIDNLNIFLHDKIGIIGVNGSGKTTLLNVIGNFTNIDEGKIDINGKIAYIKQFEDFETNLSGGERQKSIIYSKINENADILLADEPSSNLDIKSIEELKRKLKEYNGTLLIISHDRDLLDEVCNLILEIDKGCVKLYKGNYSSYRKQKDLEVERRKFEYIQYINEKERLKNAVILNDKNAKTMKKAPSRMGNSEARLHKRKTANIRKKVEGHSKAMQVRIDKLEEKERPDKEYQIYMKPIEDNVIKVTYIIRCDNLSIKLGKKDIIKNAKFNIKANKTTVLLGNNGVGKTTLVNSIISKDNQIKINPQVKIGYFSQNMSDLNPNKTILENIMEDSIHDEANIRTILGNLLIQKEDVYKKVEVLSGGERVKVAIAKLILSNSNFLILDEPTNFLDLKSIEALEKLIQEYKGTILLITHDKTLADNVANDIILIEDKNLIEFEGNYSKYMQYKENINKQKNKPNANKKILLEFKLSSLNSQIALTNDANKKAKLLEEYNILFQEYNEIKY